MTKRVASVKVSCIWQGDLDVSKLEVYSLSLSLSDTLHTAMSKKNPNSLSCTSQFLVFLSTTKRLGRLFHFILVVTSASCIQYHTSQKKNESEAKNFGRYDRSHLAEANILM